MKNLLRVSLTVTLLAAALATPAAAAPKSNASEAEAAIKRGVELRKSGDDEAALREFKRANELAPSPRAIAQMGIAEQSLGRWPDAEEHLTAAMASKGDSWVEKNRGVLEASLRTVRSRVGRLHIAGDPPGAEIAIDGQPHGRLPVTEPLKLLPGTARVEVRAPGYAPFIMSVSVPAGQVTEVAVRLEKERDLPTPDPSAADGPDVQKTGPAPLPAPGETPAWVPTARVVSLVATGVAVAAGVTGLVLRESHLKDFNTVPCQLDVGAVYGPKGRGDPTCQSKLDSANTSKTVAIAGFVGAGVLAITSAVLYFAF